jgi:hypothetical protein
LWWRLIIESYNILKRCSNTCCSIRMPREVWLHRSRWSQDRCTPHSISWHLIRPPDIKGLFAFSRPNLWCSWALILGSISSLEHLKVCLSTKPKRRCYFHSQLSICGIIPVLELYIKKSAAVLVLVLVNMLVVVWRVCTLELAGRLTEVLRVVNPTLLRDSPSAVSRVTLLILSKDLINLI